MSSDFSHLKPSLNILSTVGKGTFGRVQLAQHRQNGQYYALKSLYVPRIIAQRQVQHVHNEKRLLEKLSHPFIVKMFETAVDNRYLYMIFEYCEGGELFSYIRAVGSLSSQITKFYAAQIVLALEYLHSLYIVYRDLKPENVLLHRSGRLWISERNSWKVSAVLSAFANTAELASRRGHNQLVDFWALGILIFEMRTGRAPWPSDSGHNNPAENVQQQIIDSGGQVSFPPQTFSPNAKLVDLNKMTDCRSLVAKLLTIEPTERLGNGSVSEIKTHQWFEEIDFEGLLAQTITPPLIPTLYFEGDTGNFDSFEEEDEMPTAKQRDLDLFSDW